MQLGWMAVFTAVFAWSAIRPKHYPTWVLEVLPAVIAAASLTTGHVEEGGLAQALELALRSRVR